MRDEFLTVVLIVMMLIIGGLTVAVIAISVSLRQLWRHHSDLVNQVVRLPLKGKPPTTPLEAAVVALERDFNE